MRYVACFLILFWGLFELAAEQQQRKTINIVGRKDSVVTKTSYALGDIASINSRYVKDDEAMIALKKIQLGQSPRPGKKVSISAARVLERMREEGVNIRSVGYSMPRLMNVTRASRVISKQEVEIAIQDALERSGRDSKLLSVTYNEPAHVLPGLMAMDVSLSNGKRPGELRAMISAEVVGSKAVRFTVPALIEEWTEVPVAKRPLYRGAVVGHEDIMMARLSTAEIPSDAARDSMNIVGFETSRPINYGEVFRKNKLDIPPVIKKGEKIVLRYQSKFLQATATGVAMEDGAVGQNIKVRNNASRKIVGGKVLEPGLVGVSR